ncbi:MAG: hypothetical protein JSS61_05035 [Verrucomicrobia bacterium]|nr:hypothetical protein [Verrucomicrobiota bacterium]
MLITELKATFFGFPLETQQGICERVKTILGIQEPLEHLRDLFSHPRFHAQTFEQVFCPVRYHLFTEEEKGLLHAELKYRAQREGVAIEDWDADWGKYHPFDSIPRFVKACAALANPAREVEKQYPKIPENLLACCPDQVPERAERYLALQNRFDALCAKHPELANELRIRAWHGIQRHYLMHPDLLPTHHLISVLDELQSDSYDTNTLGIYYDRLLSRLSFHPSILDIGKQTHLLKIRDIAKQQLQTNTLQRADESFCKEIYVLRSQEGILGKLKPLPKQLAITEAYAAASDQVLGFGMTAPTMLVSMQLKERVFKPELIQSLPGNVKNGIFGSMYQLFGKGKQIHALGEKLFCDLDGYTSERDQKIEAINHYLSSEIGKQYLNDYGYGSLQQWISLCGRAYDLLVNDPNGGKKLRSAPKALCHLYALLGMIKGSKDCSSGNTLVEYDPTLGRVVNFWDFDDERSLCTSTTHSEMRMWQLGLPQCAQPFDRALLLLFSDEDTLIQRLIRQQGSSEIPRGAYEAQNTRFRQILSLFREELQKETPTLTPQDLFFTLFGGREEFNALSEGTSISPIEIFEFNLSEAGKTHWYGDQQNRVGENMKQLNQP